MRPLLLLLGALLFIGVSLSQTTEEVPPYLKTVGKFFSLLFNVAVKGGNVSLTFYIVLVVMALVVFYLVRNAAAKFLKGPLGENNRDVGIISNLIALAITFLTFSNTTVLIAILAIASAPLSIYFVIALVFGALGAFWTNWGKAWGAAAVVAFLGMFFVYNFVPINVESLNRVAGLNLPNEPMTAWKALERVSPNLGTTFGLVFLAGAILTGAYFIWVIITSVKKERES